jgi:hypothetical protein
VAARKPGFSPQYAADLVRRSGREARFTTKHCRSEAAAPSQVDWDHQQAACPQGAVSREWRPLRISGHDYIQVKFAKADCLACPQCTTSATRPRALALLPTRNLQEIQMHNRLDQTTEEWQRRYAIRAGIEATLSQNVRACGLRRSRHRGLKRTHVRHVLTALACNIARIADWINTPSTARRRASHFRALAAAA